MTATTLALVGATGGAGTTRTAVELAAMLARDGRDVAVLDAAYATQGLSDYAPGRLDPDLTALVTDRTDEPLSAAATPLPGTASLDGRVDLLPARAPFERLARAKTVEAAAELERRISEAAAAYDRVVVDVPPLASNEAVAAVNAADRVCLVAPGTDRGADARERLRDRLRDVGSSADATVAVRGDLDGADVSLPAVDDRRAPPPTCASGTGPYVRAVATAAAEIADAPLDLDLEPEGRLAKAREGLRKRR